MLETDFESGINQLPAAINLYQIPVEISLSQSEDTPKEAGQLIALFECRQLDCEFEAICQVKFAPLIWKANDPELIRNIRIYDNKQFSKYNKFQIYVNKYEKKVNFGPASNIYIENRDFRGIGVGTYGFNEIISWVKNNFPDFKVSPISVSDVDAEDPINRRRRNHFYEKFGLKGIFNDAEQRSGKYYIDKVSSLITSNSPNHWKKIELPEMIVSQFVENDKSNYMLINSNKTLEIEINSGLNLVRQIKRKNKIIWGLIGLQVLWFLLDRLLR